MSTSDDLFAALQAGDAGRVAELLADDPALAAARNPGGVSALLQARYQLRSDLVDLLRAAHPGLDVFEAAALGEQERLAELLERDPGLIAACSTDGFTPLHLAAFFGEMPTVELLLERGAPVNAAAQNPSQVMPLHSAVALNHHAVVERLVAAGADVNARQQGGWTPLQGAAHNGQQETVRFLLDHGADAVAKSEQGLTAADLARAKKHQAVADLLGRRREPA